MNASTLLRTPILAITLCLLQRTSAQDTLFLHNGRVLPVKIEEIGLDEVKYSDPASGLTLVMVLDKSEVARAKLADGTVITFTQDTWSAGFSEKVLRKRHVVKMDLLAPVASHLVFGYEQVLKPWMNFEGKLGVIGVGVSRSDNDYAGVMVKAGIKFISRPEQQVRGMKLGHPLAGSYVKPEIIFNTYTMSYRYENNYWDPSSQSLVHTSQRKSNQFSNLAVNVVLGKQRFLGNGVTLDTFIGLGFGGQWSDSGSERWDEADEYQPYAFSHLYLGNSFPLIISAGMTLGVAF